MTGCDCSLDWFCSQVGVFSICVCSNVTDVCGIRRDCMCQNNGTCLTQTFDSPCSCDGLYTGRFCDTEIEFTTTEITKADLTSVPDIVTFTGRSDITSGGGVNVSDKSTLIVPVTSSPRPASTTSSSPPASYVANIPIIIGALGGFVALLLLLVLVFVCIKKHRKRRENKGFDFTPKAIRKRSTIPATNGVPLKYVNQDSPSYSVDRRINGVRLESECGEAVAETSIEQPSKSTNTNGGYMPISRPAMDLDKEPRETTPSSYVETPSPKSTPKENIQDFSDEQKPDHDISTITTPNVDENDITLEISAEDLDVKTEAVENQTDTLGLKENVDTVNLSPKIDCEATIPSERTEVSFPAVTDVRRDESVEPGASPKDTTPNENIEVNKAPMETKERDTVSDPTSKPTEHTESDNVTRIMLT